MASSTQWIWVWVDSGSWWWTGRPGMLWFMESKRVGHDWVTELNWTMPTLMPNGPGTDHTPPRKPLQPLNSGFLIYFLLPPLVNCYPLPYLRVLIIKSFIQFSSVAQLCPTLCNPMNCSTPGLPVHHQLPELAQTHVYWVGDAIRPSHKMTQTDGKIYHVLELEESILSKWL